MPGPPPAPPWKLLHVPPLSCRRKTLKDVSVGRRGAKEGREWTRREDGREGQEESPVLGRGLCLPEVKRKRSGSG